MNFEKGPFLNEMGHVDKETYIPKRFVWSFGGMSYPDVRYPPKETPAEEGEDGGDAEEAAGEDDE